MHSCTHVKVNVLEFILSKVRSGCIFIGHKLLHHSGSTYGFNSYITLLPDQGIGIQMSMNSFDRNFCARKSIHMYIMDILLEIVPSLNSTSSCKSTTPWSGEPCFSKSYIYDDPLTADLNLEAYTGSYHHHAYGTANITLEDQNLFLRYGQRSDYRLVSKGGNTFYGIPVGIVMRSLTDLHFNSTTGNVKNGVDMLIVTSWEKSYPPVLVKTLNATKKPESIKHCVKGIYKENDINNARSPCGVIRYIFVLCFLIFFLFTF